MSSSQHQNNSDSQLNLQVQAKDRSDQRINVKNRKTTIGSHENCTVVLHSQSVQPLHCLVIQGEAGTVVRNFHADTRLNGESVGDAWFQQGDTISVGNVDLNHVANTSNQAAENLEENQKPDGYSPIAESSKEIEARSQQVLDLVERLGGLETELGLLKESNSQLEQKADEFEQQVTEKLEEVDRLEQQNEDLLSRLEFTRQDREMIQDLGNQAKEISNKTVELETALEKKDEIIEQFARQNSSLAQQLNQLRDQTETVESDVSIEDEAPSNESPSADQPACEHDPVFDAADAVTEETDAEEFQAEEVQAEEVDAEGDHEFGEFDHETSQTEAENFDAAIFETTQYVAHQK